MITIIGSGRVGSSTAMRLAGMNLDDILLIDVVEGLAEGEALDISHSSSFDVDLRGSSSFGDMRGSDLIINTAGLARKPGMERPDLMEKNAGITKSVAHEINKHAPGSVVIQVANPVDIMALVMLRGTGFGRERVIGMGGVLDTMRFSYYISRQCSVPPRKVESMVLGEHGCTMVPLVSQARIGGLPLSDKAGPDEIRRIVELTRNAGAQVIGLKGSTFYAPSLAIANMAEAIIEDTRKVFPASVFLRGEYGVSGICAGVPARIGSEGLVEIVELEITDDERAAFSASCDSLRQIAHGLGLSEGL